MVELDRIRDGDISIRMYSKDHPPPHVHAFAAGNRMSVNIRDGAVTKGHLPTKLTNRVLDYVKTHRQELLDAWADYERGVTPGRLDR